MVASHRLPGNLLLLGGVAAVGGIVALALGLHEAWRRRILADRPTSKAGAAGLGSLEVQGRAGPTPGRTSPIQGRACVFRHYKVELFAGGRRGDPWITVDERRSAEPFHLEARADASSSSPAGRNWTFPPVSGSTRGRGHGSALRPGVRENPGGAGSGSRLRACRAVHRMYDAPRGSALRHRHGDVGPEQIPVAGREGWARHPPGSWPAPLCSGRRRRSSFPRRLDAPKRIMYGG
jgi:hypothetical protein